MNLKEWVKSEEVYDFNGLIQLMALEKFYSFVSPEMRFWIEDHNQQKTIEKAGELADYYVSTKGPCSKFEQSSTNKNPIKLPEKNEQQTYKTNKKISGKNEHLNVMDVVGKVVTKILLNVQRLRT